jgi:hypothetical protein
MRKKRLVAFSLMIGLWASFITPQIDSAITASAQDAKPRQDGFIAGCSETVIDALDKCIQERFSKFDMRFGFGRVAQPMPAINRFVAETQSEREAISELEKGGWQVAFYLVGRRILDPKPVKTNLADLANLEIIPPVHDSSIIAGPIAITPSIILDERERARDHRTGQIVTIPSDISGRKKMLEQLELPTRQEIRDDARKAMLEFEKRDQYDFSFRKWSIAARPIRAKEACLKCHTREGFTAPGLTPPKVGDALGVAMYAYARKQKGASTLIR